MPEKKKDDKDAIKPDKCILFLEKPWSYLTVDLILYAPNVANRGFWRMVPTIAL